MLKRLLFFIIILQFSIHFGQVPHGAVIISAKSLLSEPTGNISTEKQLKNILAKQNISILPAYATVSYKKNEDKEIRISYSKDENSVTFSESNFLNLEYYHSADLYDGWINFNYLPNNYNVSKISKDGKEMLIYFYVGTICDKNRFPTVMRNNIIGDIYWIAYPDITFNPGTYLINIFDADKCLVDHFSEYYKFLEATVVVKNQAVIKNKLTDKIILPEELPQFLNNKKSDNHQEIEKIVSVFK
jgi:hypothetical protein